MDIKTSDLSGWISRCPVIAILRGLKPVEAESVGLALEEAGVRIIEVPLNSPDPLRSIETLARTFGERMLIGAGTLTDSAQVAEVMDAGGRLVVTPHADLSIVRAAKEAEIFAVPGFFNPTEAFALLKAGADAIKLFPAEVLGPTMLKALKAVLPKDALVIPVGGVDKESIGAWITAGGNGFGVGSSIYKPGDDRKTINQKAKLLVDEIRRFKKATD